MRRILHFYNCSQPLLIILSVFCIVEPSFAQAPKLLKPIIEVVGADSGEGLGLYGKGVGDMNKDGFGDVVVSTGKSRKSFLYYGGNPMSPVSAKTFYGGGRIAAGDFNGDGWKDLAIEAYGTDTVLIYYGGPKLDTIPDVVLQPHHYSPYGHEGFGAFNLRVADFNRDGYDDLLVSAPEYPYVLTDSAVNSNGKLFVYPGTANGLDSNEVWSVMGDSKRVRLGTDFAVGDVNNDGKPDIIALGWNVSTLPGSNFFYYIMVFTNKGNFVFDQSYYIDSRTITGGFGERVECFDIDGDGIDDILVNGIYVFKGGAQIDTLPSFRILPPNNDTTDWGRTPWVSGGGDYNRDGIKDLFLSTTQGYFGGIPGVFVYLGRKGHLPQYVASRTNPDCCGDPFDTRPDNAGDVNGDGVDDIIIGATATPFTKSNGMFGIYSGDTTMVTEVVSHPDKIPTKSELQQNYPNPFNPETTIDYTLTERESVSLRIYDGIGKEIKLLMDGVQGPGSYRIQWDGTGNKGEKLPSGVYYYKLKTSNNSEVKKAILLK